MAVVSNWKKGAFKESTRNLSLPQTKEFVLQKKLLWAEIDHMSLYGHRKAFEKWEWLHTYAGFPWKPALSSKPKKSRAPRIAGEGQATPADPQILIELDVEAGVGQWIQAENAPYLDMADMLWQGCLRTKRVQRSFFLRTQW